MTKRYEELLEERNEWLQKELQATHEELEKLTKERNEENYSLHRISLVYGCFVEEQVGFQPSAQVARNFIKSKIENYNANNLIWDDSWIVIGWKITQHQIINDITVYNTKSKFEKKVGGTCLTKPTVIATFDKLGEEIKDSKEWHNYLLSEQKKTEEESND